MEFHQNHRSKLSIRKNETFKVPELILKKNKMCTDSPPLVKQYKKKSLKPNFLHLHSNRNRKSCRSAVRMNAFYDKGNIIKFLFV